jgi:hypothetical protein
MFEEVVCIACGNKMAWQFIEFNGTSILPHMLPDGG